MTCRNPCEKIVVFSERLKEKNSEALDRKRWIIWTGCRRRQRDADFNQRSADFFTRHNKAHPFAPVNLAEIASDVVNDLEGRIELVKAASNWGRFRY